MGSDEENLDDLLRSIMESEDETGHSEEENSAAADAGTENEYVPGDFDLAIEDSAEEEGYVDEAADAEEDIGIDGYGEAEGEYADLEKYADLEEDADNETYASDSGMADFAIEDFAVVEPETSELEAAAAEEGERTADGNSAAEESDADMADFAIEDYGVVEPEEEDAVSDNIEDMDTMFAVTDDFSEESVMTDDSTLTGALDDITDADDMLALLESMSDDAEEDESKADDNGSMHESEEAETAETEKTADKKEKKEKKKGRFSKFFSGKKKEQQESQEESADAANQEEVLGEEDVPREKQEWEELVEEFPMDEDLEKLFGTTEQNAAEETRAELEAAPAEPEVKKQNIFLKILSFLTEADDDGDDEKLKAVHGMEPSDENKNILEELDKEDKKKKKKKVKGKKGQPEETQGELDEDGEIIESSTKDKKKEKKKKKKEKPAKDESPELLVKEKTGKKVSKKNIAVIAGLCLTLTAVIVVLCSIVPGFFDKRKARESYYRSDYEKSYELLYGKKLDNSDTIIFNKSRIVLELNRKLNSYHNYLGIGKEVQALDALMSGVEKYPDILAEAEEYHVTQEINAVYQTLLNILSDKYDISEPVAKVIIAYDDLTYTRKLESIVYRTPFAMPGEEAPVAADVLPEEQLLFEEDSEAVERDDSAMTGAADGVNRTQEEEFPADNSIENPEENSSVNSDETVQEDSAVSEGNNSRGDMVSQETVQAQENNTVPSDSDSIAPADSTQQDGAGSQGELIDGIRQPVDVEIHGD